MNIETAPRPESPADQAVPPPEVLERLIRQGALEVVTTAAGETLYIPPSLDE
jgi:hypothetical protein